MESIKNINSQNQNNNNNNYYSNGIDEPSNSADHNNQTFDLAQILKTGHQKRKFSNTSTVNWLQTWRVSNL